MTFFRARLLGFRLKFFFGRRSVRLNLKIAIVKSGKSQRQIAAACKIPENRFSSIVHGWTDPRDGERAAIAAVLGKATDELFVKETNEFAKSARGRSEC